MHWAEVAFGLGCGFLIAALSLTYLSTGEDDVRGISIGLWVSGVGCLVVAVGAWWAAWAL